MNTENEYDGVTKDMAATDSRYNHNDYIEDDQGHWGSMMGNAPDLGSGYDADLDEEMQDQHRIFSLEDELETLKDRYQYLAGENTRLTQNLRAALDNRLIPEERSQMASLESRNVNLQSMLAQKQDCIDQLLRTDKTPTKQLRQYHLKVVDKSKKLSIYGDGPQYSYTVRNKEDRLQYVAVLQSQHPGHEVNSDQANWVGRQLEYVLGEKVLTVILPPNCEFTLMEEAG